MPRKWNMVDIKSVIPPHLFEINASRGIQTLATNILVALGLGYAVVVIDEWLNSWYHRAGLLQSCFSPAIWVLYWWFQSLAFAGIWVIGHECGHGAFSNSKVLCDSIGIVLCPGTYLCIQSNI